MKLSRITIIKGKLEIVGTVEGDAYNSFHLTLLNPSDNLIKAYVDHGYNGVELVAAYAPSSDELMITRGISDNPAKLKEQFAALWLQAKEQLKEWNNV